jgi:hypothetical protein
MDSDEKKLGGGAGGGNGGHEDYRDVKGNFERVADTMHLWTHFEDNSGNIVVHAGGTTGKLSLMGLNRVTVRTKPSLEDGLMGNEQPGVSIYAPDDGDEIVIQRGQDVGSSQLIDFEAGMIHIHAGDSGQLLLSAGNSYIKITPAGIEMKGTLIQIN